MWTLHHRQATKRAPFVFLLGLVLTSMACSHRPLRSFDCDKVLQLRLGQSPDDVRALLGTPASESEWKMFWEGTRVADYVMWFNDWETSLTEVWFGTSDTFYVEFFKNRLISVHAFGGDRFLLSFEDSIAIDLGSPSYGQRQEPVRYTIGPAFNRIFRCGSGFSLEHARVEFAAAHSTH